MIRMSSAEAQNHFGELLDTAQREPIAITRRGRPAAFVVSPQDMTELLDARRRRSKAVSELNAWSEKTQKKSSRTAASLTDTYINRLVHETR